MSSAPSTRIVLITGTDTGVGKTVVTAWLTRHLGAGRHPGIALKPLSSGDRADAEVLGKAMGGQVPLETINPWFFQLPLAPVLAARAEGRRVHLAEVVRHIRSCAREAGVVLVEGAGGLLSPLGEGFDSRDLMVALRAVPVIVGPNRLGAVNQVRLVLEALPRARAREAVVVLLAPARPDAATGSNAALLGDYFDPDRLVQLPWAPSEVGKLGAVRLPALRRGLARLIRMLELEVGNRDPL